MSDPDWNADDQAPSKSERKRRHLALQALARELVALPAPATAQIGLPEAALERIALARRLSRGALKRQVKFIAAALADIDVEAVRSALDTRDAVRRGETRVFRVLERWRDRLIDGDGGILDEIGERLGHDGHSQLTRLARAARRERDEGAPPASARRLFRLLRELAAARPGGLGE